MKNVIKSSDRRFSEPSGTTYIMINEVILATGHAKPVYIKPNLRCADTFRLYETDD